MLVNIEKLVSNSPIIEIKYRFKNKLNSVFLECSWYSLTGSIKDRVAYQILKDAYQMGLLNKGDRIVEVSSGNMGISLTAVANILGNPITIIMPYDMSQERKKLLKMYGAELIEVQDFIEAFKLCEEYEKKGYFCTHQFDNFSNIRAHYEMTGANLSCKLKNKKIKRPDTKYQVL